MAVDSRIEWFAVEIFRESEAYADIPCMTGTNNIEVAPYNDATSEIKQLVYCRFHLYEVKLNELAQDLKLFKNNEVDFHRYIQENMKKYFAYPHMELFDKIIMSCVVVTKMTQLLYLNGMYRDTAPLSWSMYFEEEFKEEFYAQKDCWTALKFYAKCSATYIIRSFVFAFESDKIFPTDLERAEHIRKQAEKSLDFIPVKETFKQRLTHPLGSFCCSKCLPLYDALYLLTFGEKLVSDFQLAEGFFQMFTRMGYKDTKSVQVIKTEDEIKCKSSSDLFYNRMFKCTNFSNSEDEHGGYVCMFCGAEKKKFIAYLQSIICRTTKEVDRIENMEEWKDLNSFLYF